MERSEAVEIAKTISNEELETMFRNAKNGVENWNKPSIMNGNSTVGDVWDLFGSKFDKTKIYHLSAKAVMVHEFNDYRPNNATTRDKVKTDNKPR